jgi:hypothetical protein
MPKHIRDRAIRLSNPSDTPVIEVRRETAKATQGGRKTRVSLTRGISRTGYAGGNDQRVTRGEDANVTPFIIAQIN